MVDIYAEEDLIVSSNEPVPCFRLIRCTWVEMPPDEVGIILPTSRLQRMGIIYSGGWIRPGWKGTITMELCCMKECVVRKGDVVAHVLAFKVQEDEATRWASTFTSKLREGKA